MYYEGFRVIIPESDLADEGVNAAVARRGLQSAGEAFAVALAFSEAEPRPLVIRDARMGSLELELVWVGAQLSASFASDAFAEMVKFWSSEAGDAVANFAAFLGLLELVRRGRGPPLEGSPGAVFVDRDPRRFRKRFATAADHLPAELVQRVRRDRALRRRFDLTMAKPSVQVLAARLEGLPTVNFQVGGRQFRMPPAALWSHPGAEPLPRLHHTEAWTYLQVERVVAAHPARSELHVLVGRELLSVSCFDQDFGIFALSEEARALNGATLECLVSLGPNATIEVVETVRAFRPPLEGGFILIPRPRSVPIDVA